jgi:acyl dehydratase
MGSGDLNPLYLSSWLAKLFGQHGRFAHGIIVFGKSLALFANNNAYIPRRLGVAWMVPIPSKGKVEMRKIGTAHFDANSERNRGALGTENNNRTNEKLREDNVDKDCNFDLYLAGRSRSAVCVRESKQITG